jgi:hypothetical protein
LSFDRHKKFFDILECYVNKIHKRKQLKIKEVFSWKTNTNRESRIDQK